jgi:hypothetical protein
MQQKHKESFAGVDRTVSAKPTTRLSVTPPVTGAN